MNSVIIVDEISNEMWDNFILSNRLGQIYFTNDWKEVLEKSFGHIHAKNIILLNQSTNEIVAALPLYLVGSRLTGNRLVSVPFGTLCDPIVQSNDQFKTLLEYALHLKQIMHCNNIEIKIFQVKDLINDERFVIKNTHKHHYLNINRNFDEIKKTFKRTARQSVRIANESNLELIDAFSENELKSFYQLYMQTRKRNLVPTQPFDFFYNMLKTFYPKDRFNLLLVKKGEKVIGGGILLKFRKRVTLEFLASDQKYLSFRPNHFLVWNTIKTYSEQGYEVFDFGRTAQEDNGLMRFKNSWGTTSIDLALLVEKENETDTFYDRQTFKWKIVHLLSKYLPNPLYLIFSNLCYRHVG